MTGRFHRLHRERDKARRVDWCREEGGARRVLTHLAPRVQLILDALEALGSLK